MSAQCRWTTKESKKVWTLEDITDVLNEERHHGVTNHPDDLWMRARNDLLDDLIERFTRENQDA
jgi:hypothetical protein